MNAIENTDRASRLAWAYGVFGIEPGASPPEVRAAIISHLEDADFVPPVGWQQAIRLLCNPHSPQARPEGGYDAFREAQEDRVAEEVEQFVAEFFSLPVGRRRAKWAELLKQAAEFPRLRARLTLLQAGLEAEPVQPGGQDPQDALLVDRIRRLFLLKPGAQDLQRRQWLATMTGDWRLVVRRVRAKYPKLARLDADFLSALLSADHGTAAATPRAAVAARPNLATALIKRPRPTANSNSGGSAWRGSWWVILAVLGGLSRFLSSMQSPSTNNSYNPPRVPSPHEIDRILKNAPARGEPARQWPNGSPSPPNIPYPRTNVPSAQEIEDILKNVRALQDEPERPGPNRSPPWPPNTSYPRPTGPAPSRPATPPGSPP